MGGRPAGQVEPGPSSRFAGKQACQGRRFVDRWTELGDRSLPVTSQVASAPGHTPLAFGPWYVQRALGQGASRWRTAQQHGHREKQGRAGWGRVGQDRAVGSKSHSWS